MNDKEKVWKKLTDDVMQIDAVLDPSARRINIQDGIAVLQEIFNRSYRLVGLHYVVDPATFEPVMSFMIRLPSGGVRNLHADVRDEGDIIFRSNPEDILEKE